MKKTFKLNIETKDQSKHLEAIKKEVRKYIKREKNKKLPPKVDYWKFECKFGKNENTSKEIKFVDIMKNIDEASSEQYDSFYLEIISTQGIRKPKKKTEIKD